MDELVDWSRRHGRRYAGAGVRSGAEGVSGRLACDVLSDRDRALGRGGFRIRGDAVGGCAAGGLAGTAPARAATGLVGFSSRTPVRPARQSFSPIKATLSGWRR